MERKFGVSGFTLKWIAMICMLIDHVGACFVSAVYTVENDWKAGISNLLFPFGRGSCAYQRYSQI